jgi:hypothetical protein
MIRKSTMGLSQGQSMPTVRPRLREDGALDTTKDPTTTRHTDSQRMGQLTDNLGTSKTTTQPADQSTIDHHRNVSL